LKRYKIYFAFIIVLIIAGCTSKTVATPIENVTLEKSLSTIDVSIIPTSQPIVDLHAINEEGSFTIKTNTSIDDTTITLNVGHGVSSGDHILLYQGNNFFVAEALSVAVDDITIDSPLDFAYDTTAIGIRGNTNLNVDGSVTPVIFSVSPKNLTDGVSWDITRFIAIIEDNSAMDTSTFGGLSALTNGVVFRSKNGITKNIFNVKTNGDFASEAFDVGYDDRAPSGSFGFRVRRTFSGQDKNGVVIKLQSTTNDEFQIIINDDLTGLTHFHVIAQGYVMS